MARLAVALAGLELRNPILSASGTFGHGLEMAQFTPPESIGGLVSKTVTLRPRPGNPMPRIAETSCGLLNSIGLENRGIDHYIREVLPTMAEARTRVVVNIGAEAVGDFIALAERLAGQERVDALEVNLSCPNVQEGRLPFATDPRQAQAVIRGVRRATDKPIWAKLSPNVTRIDEMARAVEDSGADAITAVNTLLGMAVNWRTRRPSLATVQGGYSGPAIKPVALRCAFACAQAVSIPVIGCGGIASAEDVLEFLVAGCTAVQVGTICFSDPGHLGRLASEVDQLLEREGVEDVGDLIGSLCTPATLAPASPS